MRTHFNPKNNPRVIIIQKLYGKFYNEDNKLGDKFVFENLDKVFQIILKAATYEFLYKPNLSINIIIKEYLNSSNFFLEDSQTKYLNALLDSIGKKLRSNNA